jgi:hypothetical protein
VFGNSELHLHIDEVVSSEFLEDIDMSLLAQTNSYLANDVQWVRIDDNNQRQYLVPGLETVL